MTHEDYKTRWVEVNPKLLELVTAYLAVDKWKPDWNAKLAHRLDLINLATELLAEVGLSMMDKARTAASLIPCGDVGECMEWLYYRTFHKVGLAPNGQLTDEIKVKSHYLPLVRMNAPAWFKRDDFKHWLCADATATWHKKLNIGTTTDGCVSVSKNMVPNDYSDVFFTWSDITSGSDYPGSGDETDPGVPDDIWEFLCDRLREELGDDQEALIWLSNLEWPAELE